jgi:hypothetical protein
MASLPTNISESTRKRNPELYGLQMPTDIKPQEPSAKRLRQDSKPLMNKLETEYLGYLKTLHPLARIRSQAKTYRLANGLRYTPDFTALIFDGEQIIETAWETKGKWVDGDSFPKLKMAAAVWPEIKFILAWKQDGKWQEQIILP